MILKMNRKSKGKKGVVEYLLDKREGEGTAITLRGNPHVTQALIYSIQRKHKYLSGGLMFAPEEFINDIQKQEIMTKFEELLFVGLDFDQYNILWVEHTDKKRIELNFVVPRIELKSGKDLDLYTHIRDLPVFDMWKNGINAKYKLSDPNDPRRQRTMSERTKASRVVGTFVANRNSLDETLHRLVKEGKIKSRTQMIELLQKSGYAITRQNKESISVKHDDIGKKALRLKGGIYSESFTSTGGIKNIRKERERRIAEYDNKIAQGKTRPNRAIYQKYLQTRIDRHQKRYLQPKQIDKNEPRVTQKRATNDVDRTIYNEDKRSVDDDRIRKSIEANRGRRKEFIEKFRERESKLFRKITEFNLRLQKQLRGAEQELYTSLTKSRGYVETDIVQNAKRVDREIIFTSSKNGDLTSRIRAIHTKLDERIEYIAKSIKGVVDEIKKIRLFKQAKREVVSRKKPKINLTP